MRSILLLSVFAVMTLACQDKESKNEEIKQEAEELVSEVQEQSKEELDAMKKDLKGLQMEVDKEINTLSDKIKYAADDINMQLERERDSLMAVKEKIDKSLSYTLDQTEEDWKAFKSETQEFIKELKQEIKE